MPSISESIVITRPRQEVWDYLEDVDNTPRWHSMFVHQDLVDADKIAAGVTVRSTAKVLGRRIEADAVFTEVDAPIRSTLSAEKPIPVTGSYLLNEVANGTLFTWRMDADPGLGGIFGIIADGLVIAVVRWQLRRSLRGLKRSLEGAGQPMPQV